MSIGAHGDDEIQGDERRGLSRRVDMLERQTNRLEMRVTLVETKVDGLVEQMRSRFNAVDKGHELIMARLDQLVPATILATWRQDQQRDAGRIQMLEDTKSQLAGAFFLVKLMGIAGFIGGVIAIIRTIKGP